MGKEYFLLEDYEVKQIATDDFPTIDNVNALIIVKTLIDLDENKVNHKFKYTYELFTNHEEKCEFRKNNFTIKLFHSNLYGRDILVEIENAIENKLISFPFTGNGEYTLIRIFKFCKHLEGSYNWITFFHKITDEMHFKDIEIHNLKMQLSQYK